MGPLVISDHGVKIVQSTSEGEDEESSLGEDSPQLANSPPLAGEGREPLLAPFYLHKVVLILHKRFSGPDLIHTITFHPEFIPPDQRVPPPPSLSSVYYVFISCPFMVILGNSL